MQVVGIAPAIAAARLSTGRGFFLGRPLLNGLHAPAVYHAKSFAADPPAPACVTAWAEYGEERFPAVVRAGATCGVQFHPEKSGPAGLRIIRNFLDEV